MKEKETNDLDIVYIDPHDLMPYEKNARKHSQRDIDSIKASIDEFGFLDPIGIYGGENIIVEGHGRREAALQLGLSTVPCIRLDRMTDAQRRAYTLAHNKTAELSKWDFSKLDQELENMKSEGFNMGSFGFDMTFNMLDEDVYSSGVCSPHYEPTGESVDLSECLDRSKYDELLSEIDKSTLTEDEKAFLRLAAARHIKFNYRNIAELYCNSSYEMQKLMEKSALVIIDINDAIKYGYAVLTKKLKELAEKDG